MVKKIRRIEFIQNMHFKLCTRDQKAIKEHKCSICKGTITKREVYTVGALVPIGRRGYRNFKMCLMHSRKDIFKI